MRNEKNMNDESGIGFERGDILPGVCAAAAGILLLLAGFLFGLEARGAEVTKDTLFGDIDGTKVTALDYWSAGATNSKDIAIGYGANGDWIATAIGNCASATQAATAVGSATNARGRRSTVIGYGCKSTGIGSVLIGDNLWPSETGDSSVGISGSSRGEEAVAIGHVSDANFKQATAVGPYAHGAGEKATAIGYGAYAGGKEAVAIDGRGKDRGTAVGGNSFAGMYCVSIGNCATSRTHYATSVGYRAQAIEKYSSALGYQAQATNTSSVAIGVSNTKCYGAYSVALGEGSYAYGKSSVAVGGTTEGSFSVSIGQSSLADGYRSLALGCLAYAPYASLGLAYDPAHIYLCSTNISVDARASARSLQSYLRFSFASPALCAVTNDVGGVDGVETSVVTPNGIACEDGYIYDVTVTNGAEGVYFMLPEYASHSQDFIVRLACSDTNGTQIAGWGEYDAPGPAEVDWPNGDLMTTGSLKGTNYVTFTQTGANRWRISYYPANKEN